MLIVSTAYSQKNADINLAEKDTFYHKDIKFTEVRTNLKRDTGYFELGHCFTSGIGFVKYARDAFYIVDDKGDFLHEEPFQFIVFNERDSLFYTKRNDKWGIINRSAEIIIPIEHLDIQWRKLSASNLSSMENGLIEFKNKNRESGFLNIKGDTIIDFKYYNKYIPHYIDGLRILKQNNLYGCVDSLGKKKIPFEYRELEFIDSNNFLAKDTTGNWLIMNSEQSTPLEYINVELSGHTGILFVQNKEKQWGIIDNENRLILSCDHYKIHKFHEGKAFVQRKQTSYRREDYACIDTTGRFLSEYEYCSSGEFKDSIAVVHVWEENIGLFKKYIDHNLNSICDYNLANRIPKFKYGATISDTLLKDENGIITSTYEEDNSFILTKEGEGIFLSNKKVLTQLQFSNGLIGFKSGDLHGFLNTKGETVIEPRYSQVGYFSDNKAWVKKPNDENIWILKKE